MPFFKRTTPLFDNQLEQLANKVVAAADALAEMIRNPDRAEALANVVSDIENSADRILRDTVALQTSSLGSVERGDLLTLLERVDDVVDVTHAAAERVWLHQVGPATPEALALLDLFLACCRKVQALVKVLRNLREPYEVIELCAELNELEEKADQLYRQSMLSLYSGKYDAMHVVRWQPIYERLERGVNKCESVAKVVEGLVQAIA
jgi:hypothetical protein